MCIRDRAGCFGRSGSWNIRPAGFKKGKAGGTAPGKGTFHSSCLLYTSSNAERNGKFYADLFRFDIGDFHGWFSPVLCSVNDCYEAWKRRDSSLVYFSIL